MARRMREDTQQFEDVSSYSSSKEYNKRRKNKRGRIVLKSIAAVFCVLLIAFGSALVYISTELLDGLTTNSDFAKTLADIGEAPVNMELDDSIRNIALFGLDSRDNSFRGQSDAIMILTVDNKHKKLKLTSILRDSKVPIEGKSLDGEEVSWDTKINAAYEIGGPALAVHTLRTNFNLDIQDYVTINFANMATIVDAFGGTSIEVSEEEVENINKNLWALNAEVEDQKLLDQENGTYESKVYPVIRHEDFFQEIRGGTYLLNGNQAVAYGRIRKMDSDDERAKRQQKVLKGLISRVTDIKVTDYPNLIKKMMPLCETSFDIGDILGLAPILASDFTIEAINVPDPIFEAPWGGTLDGVWYYVYEVTTAAERISSFIYEKDSPYWGTYGDSASSTAETESSVSSGLS